MTNPMPLGPGVLTSRTVVINDPELQVCYQVTVPARSEEDAWRFLLVVGSGGVAGAGVQNAYLGAALLSIRKGYYDALARRQTKPGRNAVDPCASLKGLLCERSVRDFRRCFVCV